LYLAGSIGNNKENETMELVRLSELTPDALEGAAHLLNCHKCWSRKA
jgi:hypothetical protein